MTEPLRYTFTINLTQGKQALVDERDWYELRKYKWYALRSPDTGEYYAVRKKRGGGMLRMHREILNLSDAPSAVHVDHINRKPPDNRRHNLRIVTNRENHENRSNQSPLGVGVTKVGGCFVAQTWDGGTNRNLGRFSTAEQAAEARRRFLADPASYERPPPPGRSPYGEGVYKARSGRFGARAQRGGKQRYLGTFETPEEARAARRRFIEGDGG